MRISGTFTGGRPEIRLWIEGPAASLGDHFTGIIDTGFNGFVFVPPGVAIDLGLASDNALPVTIADGSVVNVRSAQCWITIGDKTIEGPALISSGAKFVLFGTEFLKKADLQLTLNAAKGTYELTDEP